MHESGDPPTALLRPRGGAVVPFGLMRSYATRPLALLEVFPDRVKPKVTLMSLMGGDSLDAQSTDLTEVAPARGRFGTQA